MARCARAGYLIRPYLLIYATGGLAYGNIKWAGNFTDTNISASWAFGGASTQVGWTIGGGIEGAVWSSSAWTWKVEYLYVDYATLNFSAVTGDPNFPTYTWSTRVTDNIVRGGFNYKFW
ncbi:MAG: hypothetical protein WBE82_17940 [Xanthobacteraceae bacterium]